MRSPASNRATLMASSDARKCGTFAAALTAKRGQEREAAAKIGKPRTRAQKGAQLCAIASNCAQSPATVHTSKQSHAPIRQTRVPTLWDTASHFMG